MAKLIAPRKSQRIRNRKHERNDYTGTALALFPFPNPPALPTPRAVLTNKRQPNKLQANQRQHSEQHPQHGLRVQRDPEEALIRRIQLPRLRVRALEHPPPIPCCGVDFVPPPQADESPPGDVLEVVEVHGEEEDGDDEDHDEVGGEEAEAEDVDEEGGWGVKY
jgi:hypothetical protein